MANGFNFEAPVNTYTGVDPWGGPDPSHRLEVNTIRDDAATVLILGPRGGTRGYVYLSPDNALALADMLIARYRR